jgi:hypothetical protein
MRIADNQNARSIFIGIDATGKLKVRAAVTGAGSTAPGTIYKMQFDDYGWTASTPGVITTGVHQRYFIGIAEGVVTSHTPTYAGAGTGLSTELYDFVVGGPTILQSTLAAATTGYAAKFGTTALVPSLISAAYAGSQGEFAVFRRWWSDTGVVYSTSPVLSTAVTQFGSLSTGTQAVLLTGLMIVTS